MGDTKSQENYANYASDLITHFYSQNWEWFPTNVFGSNTDEPYGTALQIGMTLPYIDADEKIDFLKEYLVENLRVSGDSWLLKWRKEDSTVSSRSVFAAVGLAPKYPQLAYTILNAYAEAALSNEPWLLSKTDGYEGEDPIWVSGKYLMTYVSIKNRMSLGRSIFSPRLMARELLFESAFSSNSAGINAMSAIFPTLQGTVRVGVNAAVNNLTYALSGASPEKITIRFRTAFRPSVACSASQWSYIDDRETNTTTVWFVPDGTVKIAIKEVG